MFSKKIQESGNAVIIVLIALVIVAVGALAYLSGQVAGEKQTTATVEAASGEGDHANAGEKTAENSGVSASEAAGNPVVATVDGKEITRQEVAGFIQSLPPQTRQLPIDKLYPLALDQVINGRLIEENTAGVNLDSDPEVQEQLKLAKDQIVRTVYLQKQVDKKITDARIKAAYEDYKKSFPKVEEVKASHILVKDEEKAKELLAKLKGGADFAKLAKENSTDGTAEGGGELGYFAKTDVVPEFADAAFDTKPGTLHDTVVKTQFGYHIIKVDDKRMRPPADYESAKPFLEAQLRREILDEMVKTWRDAAKIERFDINGKAIEPAAGE